MTESPEQLAPSLNPWEVLTTFGAAVMETSWLVLLYQAMSPATASDPAWMPFGFFLFVMVLTGLATRLLNHLRLSKDVERGMLVAILVIGYFTGANILLQSAEEPQVNPLSSVLSETGNLTGLIPGEFWLGLALIWLVFRGYIFGRQGVGRFAVFGFLRLGVGMFLFYGLLSWARGRDLPWVGMFTVFLMAALMVLTAARVSFLGRIRGGRRNPFTRQWLSSIAGAVLATVGTGLTIALMVVGRLPTVILFVAGVFITLAFAPLLFLLSLFANVPIPEMLPPPTPSGEGLESAGVEPDLLERTTQQVNDLPDNLRGIVFIVGIILSIGLFFVFLWVVTASVRRMVENPDVEYVAKSGDLVELLRRQAGAQLRQPGDWLASRLEKRQRIQAAARIRQIYADLLDFCVKLDIPRSNSQTPLEFLLTVQTALPSVRGPLDTITQAYLKVRYGELPETREEVLAVEQAWEQVRRAAEPHKQMSRTQNRTNEKERVG